MNDMKIQAQLAGHRVRNKALLNAIVSHGVSLDAQYPTDHFFKGMRKSDADRLAKELALLGFTEINQSRVGWFVFSKWHLSAVLKASPNEVTTDKFVDKLIRLAAVHAGEYDGWGMELGKAAP